MHIELKVKLLEAVANNDLIVITELIRDKSILTEVIEYNLYLLHFAVIKSRLDIIKIILAKYPDLLNQIDAAGRTPLISAVFRGKTNVVDYLIAIKADLNVRAQPLNRTALHMSFSAKEAASLIIAGAEIEEDFINSFLFQYYLGLVC